jgi:hypothetical protein
VALVSLPGWVPAGTDVNQPNDARVHDYYLGGWHNFPADQWVGQRAVQASPGLPALARANRAFLQLAVRHLSAAGVRQFLDLGSGIPTGGNVHEVAQQVDPGARVVYVDVDAVAVAHGQALLAGIDTAAMVHADLREVHLVLAAPAVRHLIDFHRPVGVFMISVLHLLSTSDDPAGVVARYRDAVPAGSYLALSHPIAANAQPAARGRAERTETRRDEGDDATARTRDEVAALFAGWQLESPGLVDPASWRPEGGPNAADTDQHRCAVAVGRKA